ncbi:MAG TPA: amino acid ABC transporter ATP-binding protein, partial [Sulfurovum sp.]|nr:amino acid ABC transporter ATP-binding protein [Sulfurovum sp.]
MEDKKIIESSSELRDLSQSMIEIDNLNKWYGDFHVLKDININVGKGEIVVVAGPSGSGKSTLIRCINRLEEYQEGVIKVKGVEVNADVKNL